MKLELTVDDMIRIVESTAGQVEAAEEKEAPWLKHVGGLYYYTGWLKEQVLLGRYKAATIEIDGKPAYVVFYSISDQGWLVVNCFTALRPAELSKGQDALEAIARANGCRFVQVDTKLRAMVRLFLGWGYQPMGVVLLKALDENPA